MAAAPSVLDDIAAQFAAYPRPPLYIDPTHCCECAEHYDDLADVLVDDLRKEHVGDGAWDPSCYFTADAFRYYFPALARIADGDRYWLEILVPRLSLHYTATFSPADHQLLLRLLEYWWFDEATPEGPRLAVERALDHELTTAMTDGTAQDAGSSR